MTKPRRPQAQAVEVKVFAPEEIDQGIIKLSRRLEKIRALDPNRIRFDDPQVTSVEQNIRDTILEIYGPNSPEYQRHQYHRVWDGLEHMGMSDHELQAGFAAGILHSVGMLENLIHRLQERKTDLAQDTAGRIRTAFEGLDLHPRIAAVSANLYRNRHYRNAVLDASVALVNLVKEESRRHDLDGANLMRTVFSRKDPILAFNELREQSDEDEQEGMMHLYEGVVLALRNPRAHTLLDDSPEEALEYIALISLLAKRLEQAHRRREP